MSCWVKLWFAEKFVSLLIEQHRDTPCHHTPKSCDLLKNSYLCLLNNTTWNYFTLWKRVVICWKIRIFAYWTTPHAKGRTVDNQLWFAEKFVSLLIEQHQEVQYDRSIRGCDLLKNSYLCLLNNTIAEKLEIQIGVVICWKIRIFAYWTTPLVRIRGNAEELWFAEKFVSLLIEQHRLRTRPQWQLVVICWKIRIFAYWTTPEARGGSVAGWLWFAEKFVSLLIEQHHLNTFTSSLCVVICWKIRIFAYWTTPFLPILLLQAQLWFAEKFVSLLIEQHHL